MRVIQVKAITDEQFDTIANDIRRKQYIIKGAEPIADAAEAPIHGGPPAIEDANDDFVTEAYPPPHMFTHV